MTYNGYAKLPQYSYHTFDRKNLKYTNIPHRLELEPEPAPEPPASENSAGPSDQVESKTPEANPAAAPAEEKPKDDAGRTASIDQNSTTVYSGLMKTFLDPPAKPVTGDAEEAAPKEPAGNDGSADTAAPPPSDSPTTKPSPEIASPEATPPTQEPTVAKESKVEVSESKSAEETPSATSSGNSEIKEPKQPEFPPIDPAVGNQGGASEYEAGTAKSEVRCTLIYRFD